MVGRNIEVVKIPKERIGVLIGKNGEVKKRIEKELGVQININQDGEVTISSTENTKDPLALWKGRDIVKAIGRGFNPEKALRLLSDDYVLEIIDISDYATLPTP